MYKILILLFLSSSLLYSMKIAIDADSLNVRIAPKADAKKIFSVHKNQTFNLLSEKNGWYQIGARAWIASKYAHPITPSTYHKEEKKEVVVSKNDTKTQETHSYSRSNIWNVDILYAYEYMTLDVGVAVKDLHSKDENGNAIHLTSGGSYTFDAVKLEDKKINLSVLNYTFSYELVDNKLQREDTAQSDEKKIEVLIQEIIAGYKPLKHPNVLLNAVSRFQFIKRDAKFKGYYEKEGRNIAFDMDKTRYSLKGILESSDFSKNTQTSDGYFYLRGDYEQSIFPMVIYAADGKLNFIDNRFRSDKFTLVAGGDSISDGYIIGGNIGLGLSNGTLSSDGEKEVKDANISLGSSVSYNLKADFKLGYNKTFDLSHAELEVGILGDIEYLKEFSNDVDTSNENTTLVFDRSELMTTLKAHIRLSF